MKYETIGLRRYAHYFELDPTTAFASYGEFVSHLGATIVAGSFNAAVEEPIVAPFP